MRGLFLDSGALTLRRDLPRPEPRDGWTRIRVLQAGICATDQALARGYLGFCGVPGHEFVGTAIDGPHAGRRVVGEINAGCGRCDRCRGGDSRHCAERTVLGIAAHPGAFAEELSLPDANVLPVPDDVADDAAVFAEPLAAALHLADDLDPREHRRAVVAGDGKLGLLCAHALARHGHEVTVVGRHKERASLLPANAQFARGWLDGAPPPPDAVAAFDCAVEATGNPDALARLLPFVRPRGTVVLKTTTERPSTVDLSALVIHELRLVGSRCGRFDRALAALAEGLPAERLIAARYDLDDGAAAFAHASRPGTLKVLVQVAGDRRAPDRTPRGS